MKKYNNNSFNINNVGEEVTLQGWVSKKRDLGGLVFVDLRDRSGIIQLMIRPESSCYEVATSLKSEYVVSVNGIVRERESKNPNIETGEIEIEVTNLVILNESLDLPFEINNTTALEDTRLKYRYLDIRRDEIKSKLITRHKIMMALLKLKHQSFVNQHQRELEII